MNDLETKPCVECMTSIDARATRCSACGSAQHDLRSFTREKNGRLIGGICMALSRRYRIDLMLVRALALAALVVLPVVFWLYAFVWLCTPTATRASPLQRAANVLAGVFTSGATGAPQPDRSALSEVEHIR